MVVIAGEIFSGVISGVNVSGGELVHSYSYCMCTFYMLCIFYVSLAVYISMFVVVVLFRCYCPLF